MDAKWKLRDLLDEFRLGVLVSRTASQKTADLIQDKHNLSTRGY